MDKSVSIGKVAMRELLSQFTLRSDNSRTDTTFSGDIERILEKKFEGMRELFHIVLPSKKYGLYTLPSSPIP
jgi:hypothetical protein